MPTKVQYNRWPQIVAWAVTILFLLGFFLPSIGRWTGPILGVWFVGTQKPRRGFLWLMAFTFVPHLVADWRILLEAPERVVWIVLATLLSVLPFTFHRLTSPRLPGLLSTLPFPLAAAAVQMLSLFWLPRAAAAELPCVVLFLVDWIAAG